ncbi:hypothetical protein ACFXPZ_09850 [Streptomyces sp. NPDC059101]|uniref:hypothetical protein n=1 Tax=unclassified Streptomyces TaxID=2593676 RepID=UPI0036C19979
MLAQFVLFDGLDPSDVVAPYEAGHRAGELTGGGVASGLGLAPRLVERETGPRVACAVERIPAYEHRGTVWPATGAIPAPAL